MNTEVLHGFLIGCGTFLVGFLIGRLHRKIKRHKEFQKFLKQKHETFLYEDYVRVKSSGIFRGSFEEYKERIKIGPISSV